MNYKWTALTVTTIGTFMAGLDIRIVIIGLPTIARELHAGAAEVVWITQAYVLASSVSLLLIGRISDLHGRVKLFILGFVIFTVGSALSSLALDPLQLIAFRVLQGFGSAFLTTNSVAIITDVSPKNELGTLLGINQTAFRVGGVFGLTLSGLILSIVDWRGLFYVNIPIGIFAIIWAKRRLREIPIDNPVKKLDWIGFTIFCSGLTLVLVAITYLSYGISGSSEGAVFLLTGAILLVTFVWIESKTPHPILDLALFKIRLFVTGNIAQLLNSLVWAGLTLLIAFYLQVGLGYTPLQAGLGILPLDGTYLFSSLLGGKLSDKYGSRSLSTLGLVVITSGLIIISTFGLSTQYLQIALVIAVMAIGNGLFTAPNNRAIMSSVPPNRRGIASGFRQTMFNTGTALSYGLIVLFITFGIPYAAFSNLLQSSGVLSASFSVARLQFVNGFRIAAMLLAIIDAIAIIPSAMRGLNEMKQERDTEEKQAS